MGTNQRTGHRGSPVRYRCIRCGRTFTAWAHAERHADAERHCRIEVIHADEKESPMPKKSQSKDEKHGQKRLGQPRPSLRTSSSPPAKPPAASPGSGKGGLAA